MPEGIFHRKEARMKALIATLEKALKAIEDEMDEIINFSNELSRQIYLLRTIDNIGRVIAMNIIIATEAFTPFDNAQQFCCYAVAPFAYTSGSSQHSKYKVSQRTAKYLKSLLHMAAVSIAHRKRGQLKGYFCARSPKARTR